MRNLTAWLLGAMVFAGAAPAGAQGWKWSTRVEAVGGSRSSGAGGETRRDAWGAVAVGGDLWRSSAVCTPVATGGLLATVGDEAGAAGESSQRVASHWASACLGRTRLRHNEEEIVAELTHELDWNARPSLFDRPSLWRDRFVRERIGFNYGTLRLSEPEMFGTVTVMDARFHFEMIRQPGLAGRQDSGGMDVGVIRWDSDGSTRVRAIEVLRLLMQGTEVPGRQALLLGATLARAEGVRLGAGFELTAAARYLTVEAGPDPRTIDFRHQTPAGTLGLARRVGTLDLGADATRDVYLSFDGRMALDHRATASAVSAGRLGIATLRGFLAHTATRDATTRDAARSWGASVDLESAPRSGFAAGVTATAARSFYAALAADAPRAEPTFELLARVSATIGQRPPPRR